MKLYNFHIVIRYTIGLTGRNDWHINDNYPALQNLHWKLYNYFQPLTIIEIRK